MTICSRLKRPLTAVLFVVTTLFSGISQATSGGDKLALTLQDGSQAIAPYAGVFLDTSNQLDASQVWAQLDQFKRAKQHQLQAEIGRGSYWLHLLVENPKRTPTQRILTIDYTLTQVAEIYQLTATGGPQLLENISLDKTTLSRNIIYRVSSFQLDLPAETSRGYLIKLQFAGKANHALEISPNLHTTGDFILHQLIITTLFSAFLAFLLSIALYNLILSNKVGVKGHLYYSLYLACYVMIVLFYEGFIFYLPNPPSVQWVTAVMSIIPIYTSVSLMAFGRGILRLNRFYPKIDQFYKAVIVSLLLLSPITLAEIGSLNFALELFGAITTMALGILAALIHRKGVTAAKYFAISFVFIALGYGVETSLYSFSTKGWFDDPTMSLIIGLLEQYFFYICAGIEMVFLSLALASFVDQMRRDKEHAQADALAQAKENDAIKSEYTRQLEKEVAQQTKQVTEKNQILAQQNKKLVELDGFKSRFFSNISHEFRTPLTLISGPLQQMINGNYGVLNEQQQQAANTASRNSDRLSRLIEEVLMLSKLESGNLQLQVCEQDIYAFCRRCASLFKHIAIERNITFSLVIPDATLQVYFDSEKLESVLCNLLSNAFKYTPPGGEISLTVTPPNELDERGADSFVNIQVRDSGPGITEDQQARIFERFYRIDETDDNAVPGSGIGLALVKELIELHSGSVSVNPEVKQGSEFIIQLPLGKAHFFATELSDLPVPKKIQINTSKQQTSNSKTTPTTPATDNPCLLLVEDNQDMRNFIASLFVDYQVLQAGNGIQALEILEQQQVDIVISDIMMPKMDGLTLLERIRDQEKFRHLPVLLLTARAADEDRIMALRIRADDYLGKPFSSEELQLRVRNLLEQRNSAHSTEGAHSENSEADELDSADKIFLDKANTLVHNNLSDTDFNVNQLAQSLHVSKNTLDRRLKKSGISSPAVFMRNIRLERAMQLIQNDNKRTMAEVAYEVGFSSPGYFAKLYKQFVDNN